MTDEISNITSRISEIQGRIATLSGPPPLAVPTEQPTPTFAQALNTAQTTTPAADAGPLPPAPSGVAVPPASLGPLPTMPVSPNAANVVPLSHTASADTETLIDKYAAQNGLEPALVRAVIKTESDGNPHCVSNAGAMGLMQLMPENVKEAGIADAFDPEQNIAAGTKQLAGFLSKYHGDLNLALAAYNAGPGNVHKYGGVPPFTETQNYIKRVRAAMERG